VTAAAGVTARPGTSVRAVLRLLGRRAGPAYAAAAVATLANTVPDVLRQVLVWRDPSLAHALLVDVVGFLTGLAAQLWVTGAVAGLTTGGRGTWRGALPRGTALAWRAVRRSPATVLAGVVLGGAVSALLTLPASVAALGFRSVLGPLGSPPVGAFAVAAVSDVVASCATLPFLALVLALAGGSAGPGPGRSAR
jgi:hypothetical protein